MRECATYSITLTNANDCQNQGEGCSTPTPSRHLGQQRTFEKKVKRTEKLTNPEGGRNARVKRPYESPFVLSAVLINLAKAQLAMYSSLPLDLAARQPTGSSPCSDHAASTQTHPPRRRMLCLHSRTAFQFYCDCLHFYSNLVAQ